MKSSSTTARWPARWRSLAALSLLVAAIIVNIVLWRFAGPSKITLEEAILRRIRDSPLTRATSVVPPAHRRQFSLSDGSTVQQSTTYFAQEDRADSGMHMRLENERLARDLQQHREDAVLVVVVLPVALGSALTPWGHGRSSADCFAMLANQTHSTRSMSVTVLTSSKTEFAAIKQQMETWIGAFARLSLLFRDDFDHDHRRMHKEPHAALDPHDSKYRLQRSRMAHARNFALVSTLESWHQHVVWMDADIDSMSSSLFAEMIQSGGDIIAPRCLAGSPPNERACRVRSIRSTPSETPSRRLDSTLPNKDSHDDDFIATDSVGDAALLYVRAEVHRQGVVFPHHFVIGSEWDHDGVDGIELDGLCYSASFLDFRCWSMSTGIVRVASAVGR